MPPVPDAMAGDVWRPSRLDLSTYGNYGFTVDSCELTTELAADTTTRIHAVTIRPSMPMMSAATARPRPAWSWVRVFRIETVAKMTAARLPRPPIHNRLQTNAVMAAPLYGRCVAGRYPYDCDVPTVCCPSIDVGSSCSQMPELECNMAKDHPNGRWPPKCLGLDVTHGPAQSLSERLPPAGVNAVVVDLHGIFTIFEVKATQSRPYAVKVRLVRPMQKRPVAHPGGNGQCDARLSMPY